MADAWQIASRGGHGCTIPNRLMAKHLSPAPFHYFEMVNQEGLDAKQYARMLRTIEDLLHEVNAKLDHCIEQLQDVQHAPTWDPYPSDSTARSDEQ